MRSPLSVLHLLWRRVNAGGARGRYSLERMSALREYCDQTPLSRVLLVYTLSLLPSLATIVVLDALPLKDPALGWDKNLMFWCRAVVGTFWLTIGVMLQMQCLVPAAELTKWSCVGVSAIAAGVFACAGVLMGKWWVFPVPFLMVLANPPWSLALFGATAVAIGKQRFAQVPEIKTQLARFNNYINLISTFLVIYPLYSTIFQSLHGVSQFAFLFLLPVIKFVLKKFTIAIVRDLEDTVFVVAVAVDMFNALFQAKCMQSSSSLLTSAGIIVVDAAQNAFSLWQLTRSTRDIPGFAHSVFGTTDILAICSDSMAKPDQLDLTELRVQSWKPMHLTQETTACLQRISLEQANQQPKNRSSDSRGSSSRVSSTPTYTTTPTKATSVVPLPPNFAHAHGGRPRSPVLLSEPKSQRTAIVENTLELLWNCERVLLVEFVEAAIPLVYGASVSVLHYLPNAKYYPGMVALTEEKFRSTITSILVYSALEFGSLLYLHAILKRKFNVSAVHQLGFVLTTERPILQGIFVSWTIVVLSFTLAHYGTLLLPLGRSVVMHICRAFSL